MAREVGIIEATYEAKEPSGVHVDKAVPERKNDTEMGLVDQIEALNANGHISPKTVPA